MYAQYVVSGPPPSYNSIYSRPSVDEHTVFPQPRAVDKRANRVLPMLFGILVAILIAQNISVLPILLDDIPPAEKAAIRKQWLSEVHAHGRLAAEWARDHAEYEKEKAHWEEDRAKWEEERRNEERHRKEVERRRQGVYWTDPVGDAHCHAYGTRVYRAILKDLPFDLNWLEVCVDMPVYIHGRILDRPDDCHRDDKGAIWGSWQVDFDEPSCVPYWGSMSDKDCAPGEKGKARAESRLWAVQGGDDWEKMCASTPATIHGIAYPHPTTCENRGIFGVVGIWDYPAWWC